MLWTSSSSKALPKRLIANTYCIALDASARAALRAHPPGRNGGARSDRRRHSSGSVVTGREPVWQGEGCGFRQCAPCAAHQLWHPPGSPPLARRAAAAAATKPPPRRASAQVPLPVTLLLGHAAAAGLVVAVSASSDATAKRTTGLLGKDQRTGRISKLSVIAWWPYHVGLQTKLFIQWRKNKGPKGEPLYNQVAPQL